MAPRVAASWQDFLLIRTRLPAGAHDRVLAGELRRFSAPCGTSVRHPGRASAMASRGYRGDQRQIAGVRCVGITGYPAEREQVERRVVADVIAFPVEWLPPVSPAFNGTQGDPRGRLFYPSHAPVPRRR